MFLTNRGMPEYYFPYTQIRAVAHIYIYISSLGDAAAQYGNSANSWVSGPPFVSPRISSSGTLCSLTASQSMLNNAEWSQLSPWWSLKGTSSIGVRQSSRSTMVSQA